MTSQSVVQHCFKTVKYCVLRGGGMGRTSPYYHRRRRFAQIGLCQGHAALYCTGYICHAFFISVLCQFASTVLQNAEFSCFHKCYAYNKKNSYEKTPEEKTKILTTKPITVIWFSFPLWDWQNRNINCL